MPKWRIIIPVLIVALVGVIAYLQSSSTQPDAEQQPTAPAPVTEPLDVTGDEDVDVQVDALIDDLLDEVEVEESEAGDGTAEINSETAGETELDILDVEYYAE